MARDLIASKRAVSRRTLLLTQLALSAAAMAACGPLRGQGETSKGPPAAGKAAPATITYMECGQSAADFYGAKPLEWFRARYPQITVELQGHACGTAYLEKMVTLMVSGTPPDVWNIGQGTFNEYVKHGEALVLDPYIARDRWIDFQDFEPTSMYSIDGKRHMLPYDTGVSCLYYNADYWARAGLPDPRQLWAQKKWDWTPFLDAARKLTGDEPSGRRYGFGLINPAPWNAGIWLWQNGADYADWARNKQTFDRPEAVEAMQWQSDLAQRHRVMPTPAARAQEQPSFANGRIAMEMGYSFSRANYMRLEGLRWDVAHVPRGKAGDAVHVARNGFGIAHKTKAPEAAWLWLVHITGKDVCTEATRLGRVHPPRRSVANSDTFLRPPGVTANFRPFVDAAPFGRFGAPHEKRGELNALLQRRVPAAFDGELSARALATELAPQIQQLLDQGRGFPDTRR